MIDLFFCTAAKDLMRQGMTNLCYFRWEQEPGIEIHQLFPGSDEPEARRRFQRERRIRAEVEASGEFYVVADDDCLPIEFGSVETGVETLGRYPEFAMLSFLPTNASIYPWRPTDYEPVLDSEVMEHVSVGGIRVCRKGCMPTWPEMADGRRDYDRQHAETLRLAGYRVGYFRTLSMNHLGEGFSTVW